jgi:hypothetical protein
MKRRSFFCAMLAAAPAAFKWFAPRNGNIIEDKWFHGETVDIGGKHFNRCGFTECKIVNPRQEVFSVVNCCFEHSILGCDIWSTVV